MLTEPLSERPLADNEVKLHSAILLSLVLHIIAYWAISNIKHTPLPEPTRFEIEIASQVGQQVAAKTTNKQQQKAVKQKTPVTEKKVVKPPPKVVTTKRKSVLTTESVEALDQLLVESLPETTPQTENNTPVIEALDATPAATQATTTNAETSSNQASSSTSNKATNEISEAEVWGGYGQKLYTKVGKNKRYPPIAIRRHWEGDVSVVARFIKGVLVDVELLTSSGRKVLDKESMRMVKEAIEQTPITGNLVGKDFSVTIPVNFELY